MRSRFRAVFLGATTTLFLSLPAAADDAPQERRERTVVATAASSVELNPNLVVASAGVGIRPVGATLSGGSRWFAPSAHAQLQLHPVFALRAEYAYFAYFGDPDQHRATISPIVTNKLGPVHVRARTDVSYVHASSNDAYVADRDTFVRTDDVLIHSKTAFLFEPTERLFVGPSIQSTWAIRSDHMRTRVGGTLVFTVREGWPTLTLDAGVNAKDDQRPGQLFGALAMNAEF